MIELRWVVRTIETDQEEIIGGIPTGYYKTHTEKVLQYREQFESYFGGQLVGQLWSDWKDVPEVIEEE